MSWKLISFYTKDYYTAKAKTFLESVANSGIKNFEVHALEPMGWRKAVKFKPKFIFDRLWQCSEDIVWVDIDAVIHKYPVLFDTLDADVGLHFLNRSHVGLPPEAYAGTMFFRNSGNVKRIVLEWIKETQDSDEPCPEQEAMLRVLDRNKDIKVVDIPYEYATIFDYNRGSDPIIEQFQASRYTRVVDEALSQNDKGVESE